MSHQQAFHTSCRTGLGGTSGFQINAASPTLDRRQLAAMSEAHARYETPHDLPYEPTPEQMREFPVALKVCVVPTVGPVVSRTEYVGREYRGRDGRPDEGRFGNYFCHMVAGAPGDDPFGGLAAVELWDAPHWTTTEAADTTLPDLPSLAPGPLDAATVLGVVTAAPEGVAAALLEGALQALAGGPRLLVVDPDPHRAIAWLGWITYALPLAVARTLTFSSFEGRPRDVLDLDVVVTTPACDDATVTGSRVNRVDVTMPADVAAGLYTRAAVVLAERGPDVLAAAIARVRGTTPAEHGASLAIAARATGLVADDDLAVTLKQVQELLADGRAAEAAEAVDGLASSPSGDRLALRAWAGLFVQARRSTAGDPARDIASAALLRLVDHLDALPADLPAVPHDAPAAPGVGGIGAWLRATEAAMGGPDSGVLVQHGIRLGLVGLNVPVDTRLAAVIAHDLGQPGMADALAALEADGVNDHVIQLVTEAVAAEPRDARSRARLLTLARCEMAAQTIRRRATELGTFDAIADWQRVRVGMDPSLRPEAAAVLAGIASDPGAEAEIRELWGPDGPQAAGELRDLLKAYLDAGRAAPEADVERAFRALMATPLPEVRPPKDDLGYTLARITGEAAPRPDLHAWVAAFHRPGAATRVSLAQWARWAAPAFAADARWVPDARWHELLDRVAVTLVAERGAPDFASVLARFDTHEFERLCARMGEMLALEVEASGDRTLAAQREFRFWAQLPLRGLPDLVLPEAFRPLSQKDLDEAGKLLVASDLADAWARWVEAHPRTGARVALARVFRRKGRNGEDR